MKKRVYITFIIILTAGIFYFLVPLPFFDDNVAALKVNFSGNTSDCCMASNYCPSHSSFINPDNLNCFGGGNLVETMSYFFPSSSTLSEYYLDIFYYLYNPSDHQSFT
jgi:hypothetical protein